MRTKRTKSFTLGSAREPWHAVAVGAACALGLGAAFSAVAEEKGVLEEIVVTASTRLPSGFDSPKPTTTVDRSAMENRGITNIADYLNEVPAFSATLSQASTTLSSRGPGINALDLRHLGPNRTLVLIDRRRFVATDENGNVNVNVIPQTLVKRVEVVTGGASAQWGSDAVAGVVNLQLDREFSGVKIDTRFGQSSEQDAREQFASLAYGVGFAGERGHLSFGAEYQNNDGVLDQADRDWGRRLWGVVVNPNDRGPNDGVPRLIVVPNVRLGLGTPGGYLPAALGNRPSVAQLQFGSSGELLPYDIGEFPIPAAFATLPFQVGGSGGSLGAATGLSVPLERKSAAALADFSIAQHVASFLDVGYAETEATSQLTPPWNFIGGGPDVIRADNAFIPAALRQIMTANNVPALILARTNEDHGFITSHVETSTKRVAGGLNGDFGKWHWDAYTTFGETNSHIAVRDNVIRANRRFAVDAVVDPQSGQIVCRANLGGANGAPGCAPLNLFGDGAPSQAALDYIHGTTRIDTRVQQEVFAASLAGPLLDLPAGALSVALGTEYRDESTSTQTDPIAASGGFFISNGSGLSGGFHVREAFLEAGVPVFKIGSATTLDVTGAVRYADYSSSGEATTWSTGLTFKPYSDLTLRGSVSRDLRAPNAAELFSAQTLFFGNLTNPLTGASGLTQILLGGNPALDVEDSDTRTIGVVYQPAWLEGVSLSADWYDISVDQAISVLPAQTIVDNCLLRNVACENVTLANGAIASVNARFLNIAKRAVRGVDFEAAYATRGLGSGALQLRLLTSYVTENSFSPDGVTTIDDAGVVGFDATSGASVPKWRGNVTVDYDWPRWGITGQVRYVGGGDLLSNNSIENIDFEVDDAYYLNLALRYNFTMGGAARIQVYAGANNVTDEAPPVAPISFVGNWGTNPQLYDVIGRYYYAGLRANF